MKQLLPFVLFSLAVLPATAQQLEYESEINLRLAFQELLPAERCDIDGDGVCDLMIKQLDAAAEPETWYVPDMAADASNMVKASVPHDEVVLALGGQEQFPRFLGFIGLGDGPVKDAVFRSNDAVALVSMQPGKRAGASFAVPARRLAVFDIDGDGKDELIVGNPQTNTVQIYGSGETGTATEEEVFGALRRLAQNYPNPFRETTTIAYEVDEPAEVTLEVFDVMGRHVRTLVRGSLPPGAHRASWNGRDEAGRRVASGTYVYRLRVGDAVRSKQALRLP